MKITKELLREMIEEEVQNYINELEESQVRLNRELKAAMESEIKDLEKRLPVARSDREKNEILGQIKYLTDYLVMIDPSYKRKEAPAQFGKKQSSDLLARLAAGSL